MFCVFLELPYERQLRKIDLNRVNNFTASVKHEAANNGGVFFKCQTGLGFCFKKDSIAYIYSVSRFLFNLSKIFDVYGEKIAEIRCITDYYNDNFSFQELAELLLNYKKLLIPENGMFASKKAESKLSKYIEFKSYNSELSECNNFKFFNGIDYQAESDNINKPSVIVHRNDSYFWSLYNFILANPIDENLILKLSEADRKSFFSTKSSYLYLKKHRFAKDMPQYFVDAFLMNAGIYLKAYVNYINNGEPIQILVDNIDDEKNLNEAKKILAADKSAIIKNVQSDVPAIYNIPEDLLELVYIILISGRYFFFDELNLFLNSLNKSKTFFNDVYIWMYSAGIISAPGNIYTAPYGLLEIIERRIGYIKKSVDVHIANFLWDKYKSGFLHADDDSENIFTSLSFECTQEFLIASVFHNYSNAAIEGMNLKKYKNQVLFEPLKYYQTALIAQIEGSFQKAYSLTKTAITFFQDYKFSSGEYRALSLLAFFNLSENKISDALTYFTYSLDIAEHTHDSGFICEALFNIAVVYFLQNNLKQAITFLDKLSNAVNEYFEQEWKIPCLFMQGRIYLQVGEFQKAEEVFNLAGDFASLYFENLESLCRVWAAHSLIYRGQIKTGQEILLKYSENTDDAFLFLIESFLFYPILYNDFEKLEADYQDFYSDYDGTSFMNLQKVKSGFNFAEDLVWAKIYGMSVGKKMFNIFYNYYNYKLALSNAGGKQSGQIFLSELEASSIDALYQNDSFSSLYLYLCYDLYSSVYGDTAPQTTAYLSKAFKAMQKNVLSIGENDIRDKYMQKNLWNAKLFKAAQNHKLI
ncbi:tetratricopeptide repeat protein [Treponema pedis]|uniref:tetratricopeptide repeat protein n=1 Tax=Treponema pedis TaxID=409322 RepID=UPI00041A0335|nr:tetratricopeptide repeat protein [Treponema pedis]